MTKYDLAENGTSLHFAESGLTEADHVVIWSCEASSWNDACRLRNEYLGWGEYRPCGFVDSWMAGRVSEEDIHDAIDAWHDSEDCTDSLSDCLGMTPGQYAQWVEGKKLTEIYNRDAPKRSA
jgi:hypothetical protein